ncbi:MAG: 50S ribosomal protein L29 [Nevskia sp.]|nr:50S ribosomal protein L29 [Nevskia sp.]
MKSSDYVKDLRGKSLAAMKEELAALRKEQFNLRMQQATGQLSQSNLVRDVRKKIARVKTIVQQQASHGAKAS